jgi:hypothetical protein
MNKISCALGLCLALSLADTALTTKADLVTGRILCDANNSMTFDSGDKGIAGVLVTVRSEAGGFTNSTVSGSDGSFSLSIPNFDVLAYRRDPLSQSYVEWLSPDTLPGDAVVIFPQPALGTNPVYYINPAYQTSPLDYVSLAGQSTNGDWLISSASCRGATLSSNACRLTGSGVIAGATKHMEDSFGGSISSKRNKHGLLTGSWKHTSRSLKLSFKSTALDTVDCSQSSPTTGSSAFGALSFSGRGTVRSQQGKKTLSTPALFNAYVEDHGKGAGKDLYYLRVYTQDGTTLLLISGDPANPENVVPAPLTKGDLRVKTQ